MLMFAMGINIMFGAMGRLRTRSCHERVSSASNEAGTGRNGHQHQHPTMLMSIANMGAMGINIMFGAMGTNISIQRGRHRAQWATWATSASNDVDAHCEHGRNGHQHQHPTRQGMLMPIASGAHNTSVVSHSSCAACWSHLIPN